MKIELRVVLDLPDEESATSASTLLVAVCRMLTRRHVEVICASEHRVRPDPPARSPKPAGTRRVFPQQRATVESLIAWGRERKMTNAALARAIGISAPHFSKLKSGTDPLTNRVIDKTTAWLRKQTPLPTPLIRRFWMLRPRP